MTQRTRYLITTLALVSIAAGYVVLQGAPRRQAPRLERRADAAGRPALPPPIPSAREILDRRAALSITASQASRLEALDMRGRKDSRHLEAAVEAARQEFARFVDAQASRGASVAELQRQSADYRELSAELRERRRRHGEAAAEILTESQRRQLAPPASPETRGDSR